MQFFLYNGHDHGYHAALICLNLKKPKNLKYTRHFDWYYMLYSIGSICICTLVMSLTYFKSTETQTILNKNVTDGGPF